MEKYLPKWYIELHNKITNYEKEIADPVERIKVEMHVKILFGVFLALILGVCSFQFLNTTALPTHILLILFQVVCVICLLRLYHKKPQYLGVLLSVFIMIPNFLVTTTDESFMFYGLTFSIVLPNFVAFLTQSSRMAFIGFLYSIAVNIVAGPKFYEMILRESGSQYLITILDSGRATLNIYAFYDFAFTAFGASRSNKILTTLAVSLKAEEHLKQEKELLHSKSMFFSCFSHEMRNPLNCILGSMDYAIKYATDDVICDTLSTGKACGSLLLNLINNILDMGKLDSHNICLNEDMRDSKQFITNIWRVTQELFKKKKQVGEIFIDRNFPAMAMIDDTRLTQVIVNLISNACKFTGEGKSVKVVFSYDREDQQIPDLKTRPPHLDLPNNGSHNIGNPESEGRELEVRSLQSPPMSPLATMPITRVLSDVEDETIDHKYLLKLSEVRVKKTLHHVKMNSELQSKTKPKTKKQSQATPNRYILLFSTAGSLQELSEWDPMNDSTISRRRQKGTIRIEVIDSGCGMTEEEVSKLFKPFTQANKTITGTYGGTGLGLYITQSLIKLMRGTVAVESQVNVGSKFVVAIPNDPISGYDTSPGSRIMKAQSQFERFRIIVYRNDSKRHLITDQLNSFSEKMTNWHYFVEQIENFKFLQTQQSAKSTFLQTYYVYDGSSLTAQHMNDLKDINLKDHGNAVFVFNSNGADAHTQPIFALPPSIPLISDDDILVEEINNHTKEILKKIKSKISILIVDDDDFNRKIFSVFLNKEGYNIYTAQNGQQGYQVFCKHAADIKMVVVDYEMPICDGPTCAEMILEHIKKEGLLKVPIYGLTGNVSQESKDRIAKAGIRKAWTKPAKLEEIMDEIFSIVIK